MKTERESEGKTENKVKEEWKGTETQGKDHEKFIRVTVKHQTGMLTGHLTRC